MSKPSSVELPAHVVAKIQQVLGIPPSELAKHGLVRLLEDLCDTVLMFDKAQRVVAKTGDEHK